MKYDFEQWCLNNSLVPYVKSEMLVKNIKVRDFINKNKDIVRKALQEGYKLWLSVEDYESNIFDGILHQEGKRNYINCIWIDNFIVVDCCIEKV